MRMGNSIFADALASKALDKTVVLSIMDISYKDMALNMYSSLERQGVSNILMVRLKFCDVYALNFETSAEFTSQ